ncbi:MAG: PAS domain S-box protein [Chitinophagales bacterium]|nr:PAS domain S-box protein [Chitinophagales bacterium]
MNVSNPGLRSNTQLSLGVSHELLNKLNEGILHVDHNDEIQFANRKFLVLTESESTAIFGNSPIELYKVSNTGPSLDKILRMRNLHEPHHYEIELEKDISSKKWFRVSYSPIFDENSIYQGAFEIFQDITDQKLGETLLQESENRFRNLADASPVMIWMADTQNRFYYFNKTLLDFTGKELSDELGEGLLDDIFPEDREIFNNMLQISRSKRSKFKLEFRLKRYDGEFRWMLCVGKPKMIDDQFEGYVGSFIDITEIKNVQEELEEQTQELKRSNEELEQFAYVASHDLQEPLRMISSYVQIIEKKLHEENRTDLDEFMKYAIDGVERLQELINDLLNYSRVNRSEDPFIETDFNDIIKSVEANLSRLIDKEKVVIDCQDLPSLFVDQIQIVRLFQNLIENSIKFKSEGDPVININCEKRSDDYLFSINDNGIGIDEKHFERIFVIFHRLHSRQSYNGTGIGLAICKRIIERHKGRIWVDSVKGKGATFYFTLKDMHNKAT